MGRQAWATSWPPKHRKFLIGRKHPSHDVIFSSQNLAQKSQHVSHPSCPVVAAAAKSRGCGDCGRGRCEHRCGYRNLRRRFFFCWVCDWYAGNPIGQCDGVQSYAQETRRKTTFRCFEHGAQLLISGLKALGPMAEGLDSVGEFLAIFWRFFCGRGPKADMPSQGIHA